MKQTSPYISRRRFVEGAGLLMAALGRARARQTADESAESSPYTLHFKQPAQKWPDALPAGNGRLGAMVFGGVQQERIQLNEESIWDGEPNLDRNNPRAAEAVPRIRKMLFDGQIAEAEQLAVSDMLSIPQRMPCYQTLGDLHLDFSTNDAGPDIDAEDYRLQLDLDSAIITTSFVRHGAHYRREVFSSAPDQVIVVRITSEQAGSVAFRAWLDRPGGAVVTSPGKAALSIERKALPVNDNPGLSHKEPRTGVRFYGELRVLTEGPGAQVATLNSDKTMLEVTQADAVTLLFDCATSYRFPAHAGKTSGMDADVLTGDPQQMLAAVSGHLADASRRTYLDLRARHIADHHRYFRRASIDFGPDPRADVPTDQRMQAIKDGGDDIHLLPIYFQFGRYMLISSSRPGTLAANLQGIWNESVDPPWGSKYTVNINAEMNYWLAEHANLSECHYPLFDLLLATRSQGQKTARELYRADGSVVHHNTDIWGDSGPIDGLGGGIWPMGASWLSLHTWDHYAYTGDKRFLAEHAYQALRENAIFLLDHMVRDPGTGYLVTGPSCSPENMYQLPDGKSYNLCMGPTMDISIVRSVLSRLLQAAAQLDEHGPAAADSALLQRATAALAELPPFKIGHDGRLQEWQQDYADHEPGHRHISNLFGLYPEDQITVEGTPELAHAARRTLDVRLAAGSGSTGWSRAWITNCMARLGDGEACHQNLLKLLRQCTRKNLFDVCGLKENSPFQIDGNLGAPSAMIEMLLQSYGETSLTPPGTPDGWRNAPSSHLIRLLPALPAAWADGSFRGLRARGGLEIDLTWQAGLATHATLRAQAAGEHRILLPPRQKHSSVLFDGKAMHPDADGILVLPLRAAKAHNLRFSSE